jgi:hypothetical protein
MNTPLNHRPRWDIDHTLEGLTGHDIRAAAKAFSPTPRNGEVPLRFIPVRDLFLPDNSQPAGLPVFFEGRLQHFERQIGVVFVRLDAPASVAASSEGTVFFRGHAAVILRGPAVLELAFPFHVERLPEDPDNYWRDLRVPRAQFEFPFSPDPVTGADSPDGGGESPGPMISRGYPGAID